MMEVRLTEEGIIYWLIFIVISSTIGLLSKTVNLIIIFVILKFKKLRRDVTNIIILHIAVLQAIGAFLMVVTLFALRFVPTMLFLYPTILIIIELMLLILTAQLLVLLLVDWYFKTYNEIKYAKFKRIYKIFVGLMYALTMLGCPLLTFSVCNGSFGRDSYYFHEALQISAWIISVIALVHIVIIFILTIAFDITHGVKSTSVPSNTLTKNTGLVIANIFVLSWVPVLIAILVDTFSTDILLLILTLLIVGFTNPIFNFLYLFLCNEEFNVFIKRTLRCQCAAYKNEDLDNDCPVIYNKLGVDVSSNKLNCA